MYQATFFQNLFKCFVLSVVVVARAVCLFANLFRRPELCMPKTFFSMHQLCFTTTGDAFRAALLLLYAWSCRSVFSDLPPIMQCSYRLPFMRTLPLHGCTEY
jgi:hypothetical protein